VELGPMELLLIKEKYWLQINQMAVVEVVVNLNDYLNFELYWNLNLQNKNLIKFRFK